MRTLYVGGKHFFNRFSSLEAAVERAEEGDVIELCRDVRDVAAYVNKLSNITINGNGHTIRPKAGKAALDCASFVTLNNIRFVCPSRTNAIIIRKGGNMQEIRTEMEGPLRALYPTIVHRGGTLSVKDSSIMQMETYESHNHLQTVTIMSNCTLLDYFNGSLYLNNGENLSMFRGATAISESLVMCAVFEGNSKLSDTELGNFNKVTGETRMYSCQLNAYGRSVVKHPDEPADGPLRNVNPDVIPYAMHVAGGRVVVENFASDMERDCIGFYMTNGSLDIRSTNGDNDQARHLVKGGCVMFNNVTDNGFYEIRKARCGIVRSHVNTSMESGSALGELDKMIGLGSVKEQVRTIMNTISMNVAHPEKDFGFSHHMVFAGDPGTGKTTVARLVAQALFEVGAIPENKYTETSASQLVKGFVGQTGEHVESVMKQALGGVLFIDEAYDLAVKDDRNTFNNEVLSVLLRYMEDHRGELVVIAAGYEKEMREFLASNPGLSRRFQWVSFDDYTPEEMSDIFMQMGTKYDEQYDFADPRGMLATCFVELTGFYLSHPDTKGRMTNGGNGGLVRNLFQQVVFARNNRVADSPQSTMKFTEDDIRHGLEEELKKAMNVTYGKASAK